MTGVGPAAGAGHRRSSIKLAAAVVAVVVAVFVVLLATRDAATNSPNFDIVGQPSPPVTGQSHDGATFDLDDVLEANRRLPESEQTWVVVNFFASWCVGCEVEHEDLVRFDEEGMVRNDGSVCPTEIVGVTFNDSDENVADYFERRGGDWPVLVGDTNDVVVDFSVTSAPETVIIAPSGLVWDKIVGPITYEQLSADIPCEP